MLGILPPRQMNSPGVVIARIASVPCTAKNGGCSWHLEQSTPHVRQPRKQLGPLDKIMMA